jgi:hypothetical protein
MNATTSFQVEDGVLTFMGVGVVDTRVVIGLERVETGCLLYPLREEWSNGVKQVPMWNALWSGGLLACFASVRRGEGFLLDRGIVLSFSCASLVLFQYAWTSSAAWTFVAGSHVLSASGYPFHLMRNWSFLLRPK